MRKYPAGIPAGHGRRAFVAQASPAAWRQPGPDALAPCGNDFLPEAAIMSIYPLGYF